MSWNMTPVEGNNTAKRKQGMYDSTASKFPKMKLKNEIVFLTNRTPKSPSALIFKDQKAIKGT